MKIQAVRANRQKLVLLAILAALCAAGYMLVDVNFSNPRLLAYAMKLRTPKLIVMLITAFAIGGASIVFQSIINNTIVTPCLLGMNSLYTLIHTAVVFFLGSASLIALNANLSLRWTWFSWESQPRSCTAGSSGKQGTMSCMCFWSERC